MTVLLPHQVNMVIPGDVRDVIKSIPDQSVHCVVTSPPYWNVRDYGVDGQIGQEESLEEYIQTMVELFRDIHRILHPSGTVWLNLGDTYAANRSYQVPDSMYCYVGNYRSSKVPVDLKPKDLCGIPWRVALALQSDGWWLRSDIIWHKPAPMPESVKDRPTRAHEYLFLLTRQAHYYYDAEAIKTPARPSSISRSQRAVSASHKFVDGAPGQPPHTLAQPRPNSNWKYGGNKADGYGSSRYSGNECSLTQRVNKRTVWTISTGRFSDSHFAVFPPDLVLPCILAGSSAKGICSLCGSPWERNAQDPLAWQPTCSCNVGAPSPAVVFDPFMGSGTVAQVAIQENRNWLGVELNPAYIDMIYRRINGTQVKLLPDI